MLKSISLIGLLAVAGCGNPYDVHLRDAEAKGAVLQARLDCMVSTGLPADSDIVKICVKGVAPAMYDRAVAEDGASMARTESAPDPAPAPFVAPHLYTPPQQPYMDMPAAVPVPDICSMMSCPQAAQPPVQYVPISPGDPLNAGLNSYGYPTQ